MSLFSVLFSLLVDNAQVSYFHSSSQILNDMQAAMVGGQGSNMMSVPTDCDQRDERLGWMGDAGRNPHHVCEWTDTSILLCLYTFQLLDHACDAMISSSFMLPISCMR